MKYQVYTLDVWGNAEDGYEVNDRCNRGTVEIPEGASDEQIIDSLIEAGFLSAIARNKVTIDGDGVCLQVDANDGFPVLEMESD